MINGQVVRIREILHRSVQGRTFPFYCRGEDDRLYYVKGAGAGRKSLIAEWLANSMALHFGLPIAEFRIVDVPEELGYLGIQDFPELGAGYAFGSVARENVVELPFTHVARVPDTIRRDVAVFDWWVRNDDRTLTPRGGNVNLLWDLVQQELVVIDYNLAFDNTFDAAQFLQGHVFSGDWNLVYQDFLARPDYEGRMREALRHFDDACDKMPDEWLEAAPGVPALLQPDEVKQVLERIDSPDFWNRP
ncbi:HipA family kinase [Burkholderia sp. PU8-34]